MALSDLVSKQIGNYTLFFAMTPEEKHRGLQFVSNLKPNQLLVFAGMSSGMYFHTVNCLFPIDIISLDSNNTVLSIWTVSPNKKKIGPTPTGTEAIVEVSAGWSAARGLRPGHNLITTILAG